MMAGGEGAVSAPTAAAAAADQTGGEEADTMKAGTKRKAPDSPSPSPEDEASAPAPAPTRPKNEYDGIKHCIVTNDGTADSMVKLIGLKSLFARQLPKMPKDYIVRLVFDKRRREVLQQGLCHLCENPSGLRFYLERKRHRLPDAHHATLPIAACLEPERAGHLGERKQCRSGLAWTCRPRLSRSASAMERA